MQQELFKDSGKQGRVLSIRSSLGKIIPFTIAIKVTTSRTTYFKKSSAEHSSVRVPCCWVYSKVASRHHAVIPGHFCHPQKKVCAMGGHPGPYLMPSALPTHLATSCRNRVLTGDRICWHPDYGLLPPELRENKSLLL